LADANTIANDPVAGLIDIPLPPEASLWPQTWPARIATVVLLAAIVVALWQFLRHRYLNRYRREALAELNKIARTGEPSARELVTRLSLLVRRTALAAFPREEVAPLAGPAWLAFLDRTSDGAEFSRGAGRWLASAPYARAEPDDAQQTAFIDLVGHWIRGHHA
jgi:Ca-activated chloride channel family protein